MTIRRTFELGHLDRQLFRQVLETVRFSYPQTTPGGTAESGEITVMVDDPEGLRCLEAMVVDLQKNQRRMRKKVLRERRAEELVDVDIDAALQRDCNLLELGAGLVGLRGTALDVFHFFAQEFGQLAAKYGAEEQHYPVMIPIEILEELGYFSHFPQHVTFASHFPEDLPFLESVGAAAREHAGEVPPRFRDAICAPRHALKPAVCLPCYRQFRGQTVAGRGARPITMQNHVFRYEGSNCRSLARAWDFSVRDIVFFGCFDALAEARQAVMADAFALCSEVDLEARIELANDPFFLNQARDKSLYQRMGEVKYELLLRLPRRDEELAVSSFNLHRDFYTRVYDVRSDEGGRAESACMGFGLERWTYGFLSQKGLDVRRWPARIAEYVQQRQRTLTAAWQPRRPSPRPAETAGV